MRAGPATIVAWIVLVSIQAAMCGDAPAEGLRPDAELQTRIEQAVVAVVQQDDAAAERIEALRDLARGRRGALLLQLALYLKEAGGTERSMGGALVLHHLGFTPEEKLETVLPYLDTGDPGLRRVFAEILGTIDRKEGGAPDFRFYEAWLSKENRSPPPALIRYLYEVSPDAALDSMARIYGGESVGHGESANRVGDLRELLRRRDTSMTWSTKHRARAVAALETLSRDPAWWVRLYAAAVVKANPDLATPASKSRLESDPDPLVRAALSP